MSEKLVGADTLLSLTDSTARFRVGEIVRAYDSTYGPISAMFCKVTAAVAAIGAPMYPVVANFNVAGGFEVDDDEDAAGVLGQELCLGAMMSTAAPTAAGYGFVQLSGLNIVALTTDGNVTAGQVIIPSTVDGTWNGISATQAVDEGGSATYTVYNDCGLGMGKALTADAGTALAAGTVWLCSRLLGLATH